MPLRKIYQISSWPEHWAIALVGIVMNKSIKDKWREAEETGEPVKVGDLVVCDVCDKDYTHSDAKGGFIFGSYGYCPTCAENRINEIRRYGEEHYIRAHCPPDMSFADFVRRYRGPDACITINKLRGLPKR